MKLILGFLMVVLSVTNQEHPHKVFIPEVKVSKVEGVIYLLDNEKKGIRGRLVEIRDFENSSNVINKIYTNDKGRFKFSKVKPGKYLMTVQSYVLTCTPAFSPPHQIIVDVVPDMESGKQKNNVITLVYSLYGDREVNLAFK